MKSADCHRYCITSTRIRTTESADKDFFLSLRALDVTVPVIVVATRLDELEAVCFDRVETEYTEKHEKKSRRQLTPQDWDEIEAQMALALAEKKQVLINDLVEMQFPFSGPVFTSKRKRRLLPVVTPPKVNR
jgi:hypothetical protein